MEQMTLVEIVKGTGGTLKNQIKDIQINGVSTDSRTIKAGDLFIPLIGENFDGHRYIKDVYSKGVKVCLTSQAVDIGAYPDMAVIEVDDTLKALHRLARYYYDKFKVKIVGVTGSTGKTTTKEFIWSVLSQKYSVLKNEGNLNNQIGLPLSIFNLEKKHDIAVLEMGMSGLGEIKELCEIVNPSIGVITNIGLSHIEHLKTQDNIFKAKMEIATFFDSNHTLVLNGDDKYLKTVKDKAYKILKCNTSEIGGIIAKDVLSHGERGIEYTLRVGDKSSRVLIPQPGLHNVMNSLLAAGVGVELGLTLEEIVKGLSNPSKADLRMDIDEGANHIKIINDSYNASPDSMKSALAVLKDISKGNRTIAILGDMLELGDITKEAHQGVGEFAANTGIDIIMAVGEYGKWIYEKALEIKGKDCYYFETKEELERNCQKIINPYDIILIKGSRGMKMETTADILKKGEN